MHWSSGCGRGQVRGRSTTGVRRAVPACVPAGLLDHQVGPSAVQPQRGDLVAEVRPGGSGPRQLGFGTRATMPRRTRVVARRTGSTPTRNATFIADRHMVVQRGTGQLEHRRPDLGRRSPPGRRRRGGRRRTARRSWPAAGRRTRRGRRGRRARTARQPVEGLPERRPVLEIGGPTELLGHGAHPRPAGAVGEHLVPRLDVVQRAGQQPGQRGADQQMVVVAGELLLDPVELRVGHHRRLPDVEDPSAARVDDQQPDAPRSRR